MAAVCLENRLPLTLKYHTTAAAPKLPLDLSIDLYMKYYLLNTKKPRALTMYGALKAN